MSRLFDDALNQYLEYNGAILSGVPITFATWFWTVGLKNQVMMAIADVGGAENSFSLRLRDPVDTDVIAITYQAGAWAYAKTSAKYTSPAWHHAIAVFAAVDDRRVYLDGGNKGTEATSRTPGAVAKTAIAVMPSDVYSLHMDGYLAEAAVWNIALTDGEAAILAKGFSPLFVHPQNLVAYWPLIGRLSPEIDMVGGYDMALNNAPTLGGHARVIYPTTPIAVMAGGAAPAPSRVPRAPAVSGTPSAHF